MALRRARFLKNLSERYPAVKATYDNLMIHPEYFVHWEQAYQGKINPTVAAIMMAAEPRRWR